ncbi:hypothetical protein JCGZ_17489 [Jatropha curcas]|uniref:Uncharacterized protein n=1 Tax=Jatropha curcas TaxID=180498 RepID=A0A067K2J6_JATCU|nr:hypothetical protein JCGZ_17489 [Jatropha curcas]
MAISKNISNRDNSGKNSKSLTGKRRARSPAIPKKPTLGDFFDYKNRLSLDLSVVPTSTALDPSLHSAVKDATQNYNARLKEPYSNLFSPTSFPALHAQVDKEANGLDFSSRPLDGEGHSIFSFEENEGEVNGDMEDFEDVVSSAGEEVSDEEKVDEKRSMED